MKITVITLFPEMIAGFFSSSIIKNAQEKGHIEINCIQLRDYSLDDVHKTVDDRPFGGVAGMVLMAEPVVKAIRDVRKQNSHVILTSARGKLFSQSHAKILSQKEHLIIVAGHYEAVDERVAHDIDEEISIGDYVLTGGEIPAAVIVDTVVRLIPGVLKKEQSTQDESFFSVPLVELIEAVGDVPELTTLQNKGHTHVTLLEYPHYTRPQVFEEQSVPDVLISGHHAEIKKWQLQQAYEATRKRRPDLLS